MSTLDSPSQSGVSAEVEPTFKAARFNAKPYDYQQWGTGGITRILGHYRAIGSTVAGLLAANAVLGAFRYTDPSSFAVITRMSASVTVATAVTAQRTDPITMTVARAYTAMDATNATVVNLTGNNNKMRTLMGTSNAQFNVTSAVAGLSGGTKTLDSGPMEHMSLQNLVAIGSGMPVTDLYNILHLGAHPLVLANNEGFIVSWGATALATGTAYVTIAIDWCEVATF